MPPYAFLKSFAFSVLTFLLWYLSGSAVIHAQPNSDIPLDLIIVIDNSGSMGNADGNPATEDNGTDPSGLRFDAASMLIDLVSPQDRVGIVIFSGQSDPLHETLLQMNEEANRTLLRNGLDEVRRNGPGGGTSYNSALADTIALFGDDNRRQRAVIFLSDGEPTDPSPPLDETNADSLINRLAPLRDQQIPVFLLLVGVGTETEDTETPSKIKDVKTAFQRTGPVPRSLQNPQSVAEAFAFALTQLQPNTYLDALESDPGANANSTLFEVQTSRSLGVSRATFIFVPEQPLTGFSATIKGAPENAVEESVAPNNANYAIASFTTNTEQPINGLWEFDLNAAQVQGFAFVRSDVRLNVLTPAMAISEGVRGFIPNQALVVRVLPQGAITEEETKIQVRREPSCFTDTGLAPSAGVETPLKQRGLSIDESVYWTTLVPPDTSGALVVELQQLDEPLRLARCFDLEPASEVTHPLIIEQPRVGDALVAGSIPLRVTLPPEIRWEEVMAWIEFPTGRVEEVSLDPLDWSGSSAEVAQTGNYTIRYIATGKSQSGIPVHLFAETEYNVVGVISPVNPVIDLPTIGAFQSLIESEIVLNAPLVAQDALITTEVVSIRNVNEPNRTVDPASVNFTFCPRAEIVQAQIRCPFSIQPTDALPAGSYEADVRIEVPSDYNLGLDIIKIRFVRPPSVFRLLNYSGLEARNRLTPINRDLSYQFNFEAKLWQRDPELEPRIVQLRRLGGDQETLATPDSYIKVTLIPEVDREALAYELLIQEIEPLADGQYEMRLEFATPYSELAIEPEVTPLLFEKEGAYVTLNFPITTTLPLSDEVALPISGRLCGLGWGCVLFPNEQTVAAPLVIATTYMTESPTLSIPTVVQIGDEQPEASASPLTFGWRIEEQTQNTTTLAYNADLIGQASQTLEEGAYTVRLRFPDLVRQPREEQFTVNVIGTTALVQERLMPGLLAGFLGFVFWRRVTGKKGMRGTLIVAGERLSLEGLSGPVKLVENPDTELYELVPMRNPGDALAIITQGRNRVLMVRYDHGEEVQLECGDSTEDFDYLC